MSVKSGLSKAWHKFIQSNYNVFMKSAPNLHKQRKYEHINIQESFETVEKQRKRQRLSLIEYKKKLKKNLIEKQLEFLNNNQEIDIINDEITKEELLKVKQMNTFSNINTYQEYMQNVMSKQSVQTVNILEGDKDSKQNIQDLEKELQLINNDLQSINHTKSELDEIDRQIEDLEPGFVMLSGIKKKCVLVQCAYYEFQSRNLHGFVMHPETMKAIETVHYHVEHNLPVRRELLFEVAPELFEMEMETLDKIERDNILAKRPRLDTNQSLTLRVNEKISLEAPKEEDWYDQLKDQEMQMFDYTYNKAGEFTQVWAEQFYLKFEMGFAGVEEVLENLENKPEDKLTKEEENMKADLENLRQINLDYQELLKLNQVRIHKKQRELYIPKWIEGNPKLVKIWTEKWDQIIGNSFDFQESVLLPDAKDEKLESQLDTALQKQRKVDLQELIENSSNEYKAKVGGEEPIRKLDSKEKNMNLVEKMNFMSEVVATIPEEEKKKRIPYYAGPLGGLERSQEQKITLTEFPKVLFLNNQNPKKYDVQFWANHFNLEPQKLRNIFNYVSYAIPDVTNEKETGRVFRFIYDQE